MTSVMEVDKRRPTDAHHQREEAGNSHHEVTTRWGGAVARAKKTLTTKLGPSTWGGRKNKKGGAYRRGHKGSKAKKWGGRKRGLGFGGRRGPGLAPARLVRGALLGEPLLVLCRLLLVLVLRRLVRILGSHSQTGKKPVTLAEYVGFKPRAILGRGRFKKRSGSTKKSSAGKRTQIRMQSTTNLGEIQIKKNHSGDVKI